MTAISGADVALAEGSAEQDKWLALVAAVAAERESGSGPELRTHLRYRIGRLISSLLGSERMTPQDPAGVWVAGLLLALSDDSGLQAAPEVTC